jgi:hypothetical protein
MARVTIPPLARWAGASRDHSENLWRAARISALALAAVQAMAAGKGIERLDDIARTPGPMFRFGVVVSLVGATAFLIWLARVMTARGIGDGLLLLLAATVAVPLSHDAAAAVDAVRTQFAVAWAPQAVAALVFAAVALLVASTRTARGRKGLDIWPPLMGTIAFQALTAFTMLADVSSEGRISALVNVVPPLMRVLLLVAALGGLIWLFAAWRGRAEAADAGPLGTEILVCSGALFFSLALGVGGPMTMTGCWIIPCVAAGLSLASGKAQADGGLSGLTPTS